jgi:ATP-dependent Clp protease adapter protein ClpS
VSAGSFIVATFQKTVAELRSANVASAARQHGIPVAWAKYYLKQELSGRKA